MIVRSTLEIVSIIAILIMDYYLLRLIVKSLNKFRNIRDNIPEIFEEDDKKINNNNGGNLNE